METAIVKLSDIAKHPSALTEIGTRSKPEHGAASDISIALARNGRDYVFRRC